jgi:hypothetical protein
MDFKKFCELVQSVSEQSLVLRDPGASDTAQREAWSQCSAVITSLLQSSARFRLRAEEADPERRIYGPAMTAKVQAQLQLCDEFFEVYRSIEPSWVKRLADEAVRTSDALRANEAAEEAAVAERVASEARVEEERMAAIAADREAAVHATSAARDAADSLRATAKAARDMRDHLCESGQREVREVGIESLER